jgi:hypothetical protein
MTKLSEEYDETGNCRHLNWNVDRTNYGLCLTCKEERKFADDGKSYRVVRPGVPRRPDTNNNSKLHDYYFQNHEALIKDYLDLGFKGMLKKWEISSGTWSGLKADWIKRGWFIESSVKSPKAIDIVTKLGPKTAEPIESRPDEKVVLLVNVSLPEFPQFDDNWPLSLKEKWFESYNYILETKKQLEETDASL